MVYNESINNVWISDGSLWGGSQIHLIATEVDYSAGANISADSIPAQDTTTAFTNRIVAADYMGIENPIINVQGLINANANTDDILPKQITVPCIASLWQSATPKIFYSPITGSITYCYIKRWNAKGTADTIGRSGITAADTYIGFPVRYSLSLVQTK